jgi:trans-aconitate methyltransferase
VLDDHALELSSVVANNAMNRERQLAGVNSYTRELGFNPVDWLIARADRAGAPVRWLDLCCGSGRSLIQAADRLTEAGLRGRATIEGVDLVDFFAPSPHDPDVLRLTCASVTAWTPPHRYDLITCVHGLHYVGDKLGVLTRVAGWLTDDGRFAADLDLDNIQLDGGRQRLVKTLRDAGFTVDVRRHRVGRTTGGTVRLPYTYVGADDHAGPNYTGQPAVDSHYVELPTAELSAETARAVAG